MLIMAAHVAALLIRAPNLFGEPPHSLEAGLSAPSFAADCCLFGRSWATSESFDQRLVMAKQRGQLRIFLVPNML
jgi:hypothetical protein